MKHSLLLLKHPVYDIWSRQPELIQTPADTRPHSNTGLSLPQSTIFIFPVQQSGALLLPTLPSPDGLQAFLSQLPWSVGKRREPGIGDAPLWVACKVQPSRARNHWPSSASSTHCPPQLRRAKVYWKTFQNYPSGSPQHLAHHSLLQFLPSSEEHSSFPIRHVG